MKKIISTCTLLAGLALSASAFAETIVACEKDGATVQVEAVDEDTYDLTYDIGNGAELVNNVDVAITDGGGAVLGTHKALLVLATTAQEGVSLGEFVAEGVSVTGLVCSVTN